MTLAALTLAFAGCGKDKITYLVPVKVQVNDFTITQEDFPTKDARDVADYEGVKAITLAFYNGTTEVYKTTQMRSDNTTYTTFGEFDCTLPMGSYTMVVLGYGMGQNNEDTLTLTSPTQAEYTAGRVRETFAATQTVNISSTEAVDISATLNRIVAKVNITSTDNRPASVVALRATFSAGGMAFNPTTGLATANNGFSNTVVL